MKQPLCYLRLHLLLCTMLLLTACGFHLRGFYQKPAWLNEVAIINETDRAWIPVLTRQLKLAHIQVIDEPSQAKYWLVLDHERIQEHILSISSGSSSRQYQMSLKIHWAIKDARGIEIIPRTSLLVTRPITINNDRILGSHDEKEQLKEAMRRELAIQMLYRISIAHPQNLQKVSHPNSKGI